jgi:hypothetical protein
MPIIRVDAHPEIVNSGIRDQLPVISSPPTFEGVSDLDMETLKLNHLFLFFLSNFGRATENRTPVD